jgi:hypothetical protein
MRTHGFWSALWLTWRDSVFRPVHFFRRLPPRGGYGPALGFSVLLTAIALVFNFYWSTIETLLAGGGEEGMLVLIFGNLVMLLIGGGFLLALYIGLLYVIVATVHVGFMVVGAGRMGYQATFRAIAYSSGPAAFAIFPFFGPFLSMVWGSVVVYIAIREAQRTTNSRAALGFLMPLIAFTVFFMFLAIVFALILSTTDFATPV